MKEVVKVEQVIVTDSVIRKAKQSDAQSIADIYNHYIAHTVITFEDSSVSDEDIAHRIQETQDAGLPWIVAQHADNVVGYAYASKWKGRCAYRYAVEVTVYLSPNVVAKGLGTALYRALFAELKAMSIHVAMGGISLPNPASIALHEKFGMKKVAHFEQVGYKFDQWVDVGYWQAILHDDLPA